MRLLLLILFAWPSFALCQIQGIGPFKIGSTTTRYIQQIADTNQVSIVVSNDLEDVHRVKKSSGFFILLLGEAITEGGRKTIPDYEYSTDPLVKVYFLTQYEVSGVPLTNLYLKFRKDTLFKIKCDLTTELSDALNQKYGKGKVTLEEKTITCRNKIGGEFKETEKSYTTKWQSKKPNIEVLSYFIKYYDDKCKEQFITYFHIVNTLIEAKVIALEKKMAATKERNKEIGKKAKLKDF